MGWVSRQGEAANSNSVYNTFVSRGSCPEYRQLLHWRTKKQFGAKFSFLPFLQGYRTTLCKDILCEYIIAVREEDVTTFQNLLQDKQICFLIQKFHSFFSQFFIEQLFILTKQFTLRLEYKFHLSLYSISCSLNELKIILFICFSIFLILTY